MFLILEFSLNRILATMNIKKMYAILSIVGEAMYSFPGTNLIIATLISGFVMLFPTVCNITAVQTVELLILISP